MGAAYSSLGRTKVLYATSLVLLGAKAKFLRRKPSVLVALEEISEIRLGQKKKMSCFWLPSRPLFFGAYSNFFEDFRDIKVYF